MCPRRTGPYAPYSPENMDQRLFWRVVDELDYLLTLLRLRILGALAGPEPETPADRQRARYRERIERVFPEIEP
jgi:hypothetical protein